MHCGLKIPVFMHSFLTHMHTHNQMQRYEEAEKAYAKAVQLDPNYKDASDELFQIRIEQLQVRCSYDFFISYNIVYGHGYTYMYSIIHEYLL